MQHRAMAGWAVFVAVSAWAGSAGAQQGTDIYVGTLSLSGGRLAVTGLKNATNRDGYDNQPSFGPSGTFFLYTSARSGGRLTSFATISPAAPADPLPGHRKVSIHPPLCLVGPRFP